MNSTVQPKKYRCTWANCSKSFKRNEHLARHLRVHSGEKPYHCTLCWRKFSRLDALQRHRRAFHRLDAPPSPPLTPQESDIESLESMNAPASGDGVLSETAAHASHCTPACEATPRTLALLPDALLSSFGNSSQTDPSIYAVDSLYQLRLAALLSASTEIEQGRLHGHVECPALLSATARAESLSEDSASSCSSSDGPGRLSIASLVC